ncbi:hypothetical protein N866_18265 [Actinotalea ferrariae CF5-4]|uniref:Uncharacterized protein n=1 Tax=Actinotalea ferrariae CF5-4 TaxID=948458 RepID=A0A021VUQ9_9CELL|nr:hypothetical protein [Actinotalea ferrariae]EYR63800.1 hypothetical protein N866_18265 [Actinotalea ferrariae CF5-4]
MTTTGSTDWVSGERVFAPPNGTLDPEWLVPAVLEALPTARPDEARDALRRAWTEHRTGVAATSDAAVDRAARTVVTAAVRQFRA